MSESPAFVNRDKPESREPASFSSYSRCVACAPIGMESLATQRIGISLTALLLLLSTLVFNFEVRMVRLIQKRLPCKVE